MKKIENETSAAMVTKSFFEDEFKGFVFEDKSKLVRTKEIPEGPAWMTLATKNGQRVVFIWEAVTKYAYACPVQFAYDEVIPSEEQPEVITDFNGMTGTVVSRNGETTIIWE